MQIVTSIIPAFYKNTSLENADHEKTHPKTSNQPFNSSKTETSIKIDNFVNQLLDNLNKLTSPIHFALSNKDVQQQSALQPTFNDLKEAVETRNLEKARILISKIQPLQKDDLLELLLISLENNDYDTASLCIKNGAPVNDNFDGWGRSFLYYAVREGNVKDAAFFIEHGADINKSDIEGHTPLHMAALEGHTQIAELLIKKGAILDSITKVFVSTPLHYAANEGHDTVVELLLNNKANIILKQKNGETALHEAVVKGSLKSVQLLISHGSSINESDNEGWTPLHSAVNAGHYEVAKCLIENNADVNAQDAEGDTPLSHAALRNHLEIAKLLIDNHADINLPNLEGWSPLHWASKKGHNKMMELLIQNQANVNALTKDGRTPLNLLGKKNILKGNLSC